MFTNSILLYGLAALAVPPIIHILSRRRFHVVNWAAMQFLRVSQKTRKKVFLEHFYLMLFRMSIIGALVVGMAAPLLDLSCIQHIPLASRWAERMIDHRNRDIVIVVDGSYSMGYVQKIQEPNGTVRAVIAHDVAKKWALEFLNELTPGDTVAMIQAKQQPISIVNEPSSDFADIANKIGELPAPRGGIDFPKAVGKAIQILNRGKNQQKEIIVLTDGQRQGWADPKTLEHWELLAKGQITPTQIPRIWVVNVVPDRPGDVPNWSVAPIHSTRAISVVGHAVKFKYELQVIRDVVADKPRQSIPPPKRVRYEVDREPGGEWQPQLPENAETPDRIPGEFKHTFSKPGSHLVSVFIEDDEMPGDNRRDFAVEVLPALPVLVVDGDLRPDAPIHGSDFLRDALAPALDRSPAFLLRTISIQSFSGDSLNQSVSTDAAMLPRVLVLHNIGELRGEQSKAIESFLNSGGGVLVTLGPRVNARLYNDDLYRDGKGWLPAKLIEPTGDENDLEKAARPIGSALEHPALELFKKEQPGGFSSAKFPRYWKVETPGAESGTMVASFNNRAPLFLEKSVGRGRVILSTVPLDNSWRTDFHANWEFVILSHELIYYLASARSVDLNLSARQPIVYHPLGEPPVSAMLLPPDAKPRRLEVKSWPLVYDDTAETGIYQLTTDTGTVRYYVVQPDPAESNLAVASDAEKQAVAMLFPKNRIIYETDRTKIAAMFQHGNSNLEIWWVLLLLVILLLLGEIAITRRLVRKNPPVGIGGA